MTGQLLLWDLDEQPPELYARALEIMDAWIATHEHGRRTR